MARVCTITCHDVCNHGASLQAYGLMKHLQLQGHHVEVIDYKPSYLQGQYGLLCVHHPDWRGSLLRRTIYRVVKFRFNYQRVLRKKSFDRFTSRQINRTEIRYESNAQLKMDLPKADAYICGSDQIWNCLFPNGRDPAFYLDFVPRDRRRIAYAASFGADLVPPECREFVSEKVAALDHVSVREKSGLDVLKSLGIKRTVQVVDPVFLLDPADWNRLSDWESKERYLLVYDFERSDLVRDLALRIGSQRGLKIYAVNIERCDYAHRSFTTAGPDLFVALLRNAAFVISNSFHATAFGIMFGKEFLVTHRTVQTNVRMQDLLRPLGLQDRIVTGWDEASRARSSAKSPEVLAELACRIESSKDYLRRSLM